MTACSADGCDRPRRAQGLCKMHYQRARAAGLPAVQPQGRTVDERFHSYARPDENGCWIWTGALDKDGYGVFSPAGKGTVRAHRWSYERFVGPIPAGLVLDHFVCDRRACCNPAHVRPTTTRENVLRSETGPSAVNARKTTCPRGHPLSGDNLHIVRTTGARCCLICEQARWARSNEKRKVTV